MRLGRRNGHKIGCRWIQPRKGNHMRLNSAAMIGSMLVGLGVLAGGCAHNDEANCKDVKAGTVTTANKVCVIMLEDPVNPATEPVMWKGQRYGLCCEGCREKWAKLSDAEKTEHVAKAMAASK